MSEPSFANGFASPWYGGMMKYPDLWRGCVGYWAPILGPTGATLFDVNVSSKHGTLNGFTLSSAWAVNRYQHLVFNGSSTYINTPLIMPTNAPLSVWAWVRKTTDIQVSCIIGGRNYPSVSVCALVLGSFITGNATTSFSFGRFQFGSVNGLSVISNVAVPLNEWCLLSAVVSSNNSIQLAINGVDVAQTVEYSSSPASDVTSGPLAWIGNAEGSSYFLTGQIAEVGIVERVLTKTELMMLAQRPGVMLEIDDDLNYAAIESAAANRRRRLLTACGS